MACSTSTPESKDLFEKNKKYFMNETSVRDLLDLWRGTDVTKVDKFPSNNAFLKFLAATRKQDLNEIKKEIKKTRKDIETQNTATNKDGIVNTSISEKDLSLEDQKQRDLRTAKFQEFRRIAIANREALDMDMDPIQKRDRIQLIKTSFSSVVTYALNNAIDKAFDAKEDAIEEGDKEAAEKYRVKIQDLVGEKGRHIIIQDLSPQEIFNSIKRIFEDVIEEDMDTVISEVSTQLTPRYAAKGFSEKESKNKALKKATKVISAKYNAYKMLLKHFDTLVAETIPYLVIEEGIRVRVDNSIVDNEIKPEVSISNSGEISNDSSDLEKQEEAPKDNWMTNYTDTGSFDSLSKFTRKFISTVVKVDKQGKVEKDDLGQTRFLDASYVHATLINQMRKMTSREEFFPLLEELAESMPWVHGIIDSLKLDENAMVVTSLYIDFKKDFVPLWIQMENIDPKTGKKVLSSFQLNNAEGTYYLLDAWRYNQENGNILNSELSVYDKSGEYDRENAKEGFKIGNALSTKISAKKEKEAKVKYALENMDTIAGLLEGLGIQVNKNVLETFINNTLKEDEKVNKADFIKTATIAIQKNDVLDSFVGYIANIYAAVAKNKLDKGVGTFSKDTANDDDDSFKLNRNDLINEYSTAFNTLAAALSEVTTDAVESSIHENGKMRYSHLAPNGMGKVIGNLTASQPIYEKYLLDNYKKSPWFYKKDNTTNKLAPRNEWLKQMEENPNLRFILDRKLLIHRNNVEYNDWSDIQYTTTLMHEYHSIPDSDAGEVKTAYYAAPIYSDASVSEFIKFTKFDSQTFKDEYGNFIPVTEIINSKLKSVILQEMDRINLVKERTTQWHIEHQAWLKDPKSNPKPFEIIKNYDTIDDIQYEYYKEYYPRTIGGAEFKFFPSLNNTLPNTNKNLMDTVSNMLSKPAEYNAVSINGLIEDTIEKMMKNNFHSTLAQWKETGLLEVTGKGDAQTYVHLPADTSRNSFKSIATKLEENKDIYEKNGLWNTEVQKVIDDLTNGTNDFNVDYYNEVLKPIREFYDDEANTKNLTLTEKATLKPNLIENEAMSYLEEYYYNTILATSQIIQLTTTDLAFYKNLEDFQKRFKELHSPALALDTHAKFYDVNKEEIVLDAMSVTKGVEKTIYLQDNIVKSNILEPLTKVFQQKVREGKMSVVDMEKVLKEYANVNETDAQAYRSLKSYRTLSVMSKAWSQEMEDTYNRIQDGEWDASDLNVMYQTKKPFVFTHMTKSSHVVDKNSGIEESIRVPVQHKNSEFLLLMAHTILKNAAVDPSDPNTSRIRAIDAFMELHNIDVIQFNSAVKVGEQGAIDLSSAKTGAEVTALLNDKVFIQKSQETGFNPDIVHTFDLKDYGIQVATPEHSIDAFQLLGTQVRKLILADLADDTLFNIGTGHDKNKYNKQQLVEEYNALNTENILESFMDLAKEFQTVENVEKVLQETIQGNPRYGTEMAEACTLVIDPENPGFKKFNIPLSDPSISIRIQSLLNSIMKTRIVKQKVRGGALIQASGFGTSDQLHVVMEEDPNNPGKQHIKHIECYVSAYSKEFYEPLMDEDGQLDVEKLPDDLRKLIGYRVPTENKYSMVPLYIKGFIAQNNGSSIMLPAEITTMSGSDFDVDKLFIFLPEFKINQKHDVAGAWEDFYKDPANKEIATKIQETYKNKEKEYLIEKKGKEHYGEFYSDLLDKTNKEFKEDFRGSGKRKYELVEGAKESFETWFEDKRDDYKVGRPTAEKVEYDSNLKPEENSKKQRNNRILDIMWGILTNPDTSAQLMTPGGFDEQKKAGAIMDIVNTISSKNEILKAPEFADVIAKLEKEQNPKKIEKYGIYEILQESSLKTIENFADKVKVVLDPLSPATQVILQQRNITGNKLIGIYANHNASNATFQAGDVRIKEGRGFSLFEHDYASLSTQKNIYNKYKSETTAGFLAASTDNAKKPVLASLNQDMNTADFSCFLLRLGYSTDEVGIFIRQPIINTIIKEWKKEEYLSTTKKIEIATSVLGKYERFPGLTNAEQNDFKWEKSGHSFYIDFMIESNTHKNNLKEYLDQKNETSGKQLKKETRAFISAQEYLGETFIKILGLTEPFSNIIAGTRNDAGVGSYGPDIVTNTLKSNKTYDLIKDSQDKNYPFVGISNAFVITDREKIDSTVEKAIVDEDSTELRKMLLNTKAPMMVAFQELGLLQGANMFKKYFPHYNQPLQYIFNTLRSRSSRQELDNKTMNKIVNNYIYYRQTANNTFGNSYKEDAESKRIKYLVNFPATYDALIRKRPELKKYDLIKMLQFTYSNKNTSVATLNLKNVGSMSEEQKIKFSSEWASFMYSEDPELNKLATDLFIYSAMRSGMGFNNTSFFHLAPNVVKKATPDYIKYIEAMNTSEVVIEAKLNNFIDMFIRNNIGDYQFCKRLSSDITIPYKRNGKILKYIDFEVNNQLAATTQDKINNPDLHEALLEGTMNIPQIGTIYIYKNIFSIKTPDGKILTYKQILDSYAITDIVYELIEPLGESKVGVEYDYNSNTEDMESVFPSNKLKDIEDNDNEISRIVQDEPTVISTPDAPTVASTEDTDNEEETIMSEVEKILYDNKMNKEQDIKWEKQKLDSALYQRYEGDIKNDGDTILVFCADLLGNPNTKDSNLIKKEFEIVKEGEHLWHNVFALPVVNNLTKDKVKKIPIDSLNQYINNLYYTASTRLDKKFKIPYTETGKTMTPFGYTGDELMQIFLQKDLKDSPNVYFSKEWIESKKYANYKTRKEGIYSRAVQKINKKYDTNTSKDNVSIETISPKGTINVYWGDAESETSTKILSNLAPRRFTWKGKSYGSVEHAYQVLKTNDAHKATDDYYNNLFKNKTVEELSNLSPSVLKRKNSTKRDPNFDNLQLMRDLVVTSFKQNPYSDAANKLVQYENFTHNTNQKIDEAFLEGLKLAQQALITIRESSNKQTKSSSTLSNTVAKKDLNRKLYQFHNGNIKNDGDTILVCCVDLLGNLNTKDSNLIKKEFEIVKEGEHLWHNVFAFPVVITLTKDKVKKIPIELLNQYINNFYDTASTRPDKKFKIPYTETGKTMTPFGYTGDELMQIFLKGNLKDSPNVYFSKEWIESAEYKSYEQNNLDNFNKRINETKSTSTLSNTVANKEHKDANDNTICS